ncbi:MAG: nucleotidyltransferase family protein [Prevotella sp.]|nr:nucleotidyltransferase family protein [Prevotella sp.]
MEQLFFELIRVSIGQLDCLSRGPEPEEWQELSEMAHEQQMVGVCYRGVQALFEYGLRVPQDLVIDWMSEAEQIEERNDLMNQRCAKVQEMLGDRALLSSVLAGQGAAHDYAETLRTLRQPDGLDFYTNGSQEELIAFVKRSGQQEVRKDSQQVFLAMWDDTEVRLHYRIGMGKNPLRNRKIRQWFAKNRKALFVRDGEMTRPSATMNVVYMLVRLYWQFLYKGITLRELSDCFFALKRLAEKGGVSTINYKKVLGGFGILGFARGIIWVLQEVFGLEEGMQILEPSESQGSFILREVMAGKRNVLRLLLRYPVDLLFSFIP